MINFCAFAPKIDSRRLLACILSHMHYVAQRVAHVNPRPWRNALSKHVRSCLKELLGQSKSPALLGRTSLVH